MPIVYEVKCYLLKDAHVRCIQSPVEIKRFTFSQQNESTAYQALTSEIVAHFNDSFKSVDELKTYWLDDEEDLIKFSTNEEFSSFASGKEKAILRVYIVKQQQQQQQQEANIFQEFLSVLNRPEVISTVNGILETIFTNAQTTTTTSPCSSRKDDASFKLSDHEIEERVRVSLEQMKQMGYDNENDCLAKLLRDHQGNINQVLDAIKAQYFFK